MSKDFLLELLSEEIPARMQGRARADLARLFAEGLQRAGLTTEGIETFSTPRRLVLIARGLPDATEAVSEEVKGPRANAPEQALAGFLKKTGLARDQLEERDGVLFARIDRPGRPASEVLAEAVEAIVRDFPWPKSMRWGDGNLRWVRPLHGIVALLGEEIVPVEVEGIAAGAATVGHRFHHPGAITIGSCGDYAEKLRACHVIVDHEEREAIIRDGAAKAAKDAGLALVEDEGLVVENAGLTENPVPLLGRFDGDFLDVPREVIVLTMRTNQKYFACTDKAGMLAPAFVCIANIDASDGGEAIVEGNRRVLAARLADARFFWEQDLKVPLEEQTKKLSGIVFHEKLGTVADKVERVAKLARWLVEEGVVKGADPDQVERAARLAKADLVTGMVGEFPELQGVIGGYIAERQGEPKAVADAIRDHYKPVGQGDEVPTAPITVAVSLADKLDSIISFFTIDLPPTGSKDPFALRRSALGSLALILDSNLRFGLKAVLQTYFERLEHTVLDSLTASEKFSLFREAFLKGIPIQQGDGKVWFEKTIQYRDQSGRKATATYRVSRSTTDIGVAQLNFIEQAKARFENVIADLLNFFAERLKVQQRGVGISHEVIDAVFALHDDDDLVRLLHRVNALQAFIQTSDGRNLLAAYKRAANILKKEEWRGDEDASHGYVSEERRLEEFLNGVVPTVRSCLHREDFIGTMAAFASLRVPIDAFFDKVTVNADDPGVRARRLNLLARFRDAVHQVADFSRIEG